MSKYHVGSIFKNKQDEEFVIIDKIGKDRVRIKFLDEYGFEKEVCTSAVKQQMIKNPYRISVCGKGYDGSIEELNVTRKERLVWFELLKSDREYPVEWNCLENFIRDVRELKYYEDFLESNDLTLQPICKGNVVVGFEVDYKKSKQGKKVRIKSMYDNSIDMFDSIQQASEELGWWSGAIRQYCNESRVIDGYEYSWLKYGEE